VSRRDDDIAFAIDAGMNRDDAELYADRVALYDRDAITRGHQAIDAALGRLTRVDLGRMLREAPPEVPWIVEDVLARGNVTLLPGREGVGKSLFVMALVVGVVTGESAGPFTTNPGRVMVVDAENGESELHRRVRALGLAPGAEDRLVVYTTEAGDVLNDQTELEAAVAGEQPDLLVIDSLRSNWRGKENASEDVGPAIDYIRNLARRYDCAVALIHHAGKVGAEYRGSTAIGAGCQVVVGVARHPDDPDPDRFVLTNPKMRMAPRWAAKWIRLAVELDVIVSLEEAEPYVSDDAPPPPKAPVREELAPQVAGALGNRPRTRADIARAVSRDPKDRTVGRILRELEERGVAREVEGGWVGWQPHEPLRGPATPATPLREAAEPHGQGVLVGGSQLATPPPHELARWEQMAGGES
jgi:KaiC/GvpD/RAD55 family RecA-like ATPase